MIRSGEVPTIFPPHYAGRWRMVNRHEFKVDGVLKKECFIFKFDMVDL